MVTLCTASTSPACTEVMACGACQDWKAERRVRWGRRSSPAFIAANEMRSLAFHSHSRFCSTLRGPSVPKTLLFMVVSIWKTLTPESFSTLPIRQFDECSSEAC